jgi:hypothetical protein
MFCLYDQTVPRSLDARLQPVPTHANIYFRHLAPQNVGRKQLEKDCETKLYEVISVDRVEVEVFRNGLIVALNRRSLAGEFVID